MTRLFDCQLELTISQLSDECARDAPRGIIVQKRERERDNNVACMCVCVPSFFFLSKNGPYATLIAQSDRVGHRLVGLSD